MKQINVFFLITTLSVICGCVSRGKYEATQNTIDSLRTANEQLLIENDELKNGEERLARIFENNAIEGNYIDAEKAYTALITRHPESNLLVDKMSLVEEVLSKAKLITDSIAKAKNDSLRIANIDKLGKWEVRNIVDDFDKPTGKHYLRQTISGLFSNSATAGSRCTVIVDVYSMYEGNIDINIRFDEYSDRTIDNDYFSDRKKDGKIVCRETHTVYEDRRYGIFEKGVYDTSITMFGLFIQEKEFEFTLNYEYNTSYLFNIDTKYFENALIKAGILSL